MANQINIQVGADIKNFQAGITQAVQTMKDAGQDMSAVSESVARLTTNGFKTISQAYRQTSKDAETLALHLGTDSEAFKQAAGMAQVYGSQLQEVRSKIAGVDLGKTAVGAQQATTSFNGLGNSINQLTREMPAFTYSVQTGFMALSNNIPIFVDQIQSLKRANMELTASGQPVKSVFSQITSALFSWNTALSVGVTVLTVFGGKMYDYIAQTKEATTEVDNLAKAQENFNKVLYDFKTTPQQKELDAINKKYQDASLPLVGRLNLLKDEIALENSKMQIIGNQEKYNEKILRRENEILELEGQLTSIIKAKNNELDKINKKYQKQLDIVTNITKVKEQEQLSTKIESGGELNSLASMAVGEKVQDSLAEGWAKINANNLKGMDAFKYAFKSGTLEITKSLDESLKDIVNWAQVASSVMTQAGASLGAALATGDFSKVGESIVKQLGGVAIQIGAALVAMGIPQAAIGLPTGFAYIAAGTALAILGGAMQATGTTNGSNGGGSYGGGQNDSYSPFTPAFSGSSQYLMVDSRVRGTDIIISADNQRRQNRRVR